MEHFGTTRKCEQLLLYLQYPKRISVSMMFDSRKRGSSTFSRASHCQSYFENSPAPKHKEYLDFNDIEKILPGLQKQALSQRPPLTRISIIGERPPVQFTSSVGSNCPLQGVGGLVPGYWAT